MIPNLETDQTKVAEFFRVLRDRVERIQAERDALRTAITEAHRILMETYTEDEATEFHEELLSLLTAALRATPLGRE